MGSPPSSSCPSWGERPILSVEPKLGAAMLFFAGGAIAALLSAFLAYINRTVRIEAPQRRTLQSVLRLFAILAVIGSGAAFLTGNEHGERRGIGKIELTP